MGAIASKKTALNYDCLLNRLFRRGSKKTSKLSVTGLCGGEFPAQMASNAENVPISWRHHGDLGQSQIWSRNGIAFIRAWFVELEPTPLLATGEESFPLGTELKFLCVRNIFVFCEM